jgi:hypothetical protein
MYYNIDRLHYCYCSIQIIMTIALSPRSLRITLIISQIDSHRFMHKHRLIELQKITEGRISSLREEVEIAINVKLNPLYIVDRRDEIEFLEWATRIVRTILNRDNGRLPEQVNDTKKRLELADTIEFENILKDRANELNSKLKESSNIRESDILNNEIDTLESVLDCLSDLKYGDKARAIEIAEASNNYQHARRLREELCNIQDMESEISAQIQNKIEKL